MYTDEALEQRRQLRNHPKVKAAVCKWWPVLPKSFGNVSKHTYIQLSMVLGKALLPNFNSGEVFTAAEEDWQQDSHGRSSLNEPLVSDAMFELADLWCHSCSAEEYAEFLDQCFAAVTLKRGGTFTLRTLTR
eukprot:9230131-Pyramimonas_sp.AAC.1